jgi:hypothetical protein
MKREKLLELNECYKTSTVSQCFSSRGTHSTDGTIRSAGRDFGTRFLRALKSEKNHTCVHIL